MALLIRNDSGNYYKHCMKGVPIFTKTKLQAAIIDPEMIETVLRHLNILVGHKMVLFLT